MTPLLLSLSLLASPSSDACEALRACVATSSEPAEVACSVGQDLASGAAAWFVGLGGPPVDLVVVCECIGRVERARRTPARVAVVWSGDWPYLADVVELRRCQRARSLESRRRCSAGAAWMGW